MYSCDRTFEYPTSTARDEPMPSTNEGNRNAPVRSSAPSHPRSSEAYHVPVLREIAPGILSDGTITVRHPAVSAYLDGLELKFEEIIDGDETSKASKHGSVQLGRVEDVSEILGLELNTLQSECVLALAALQVYYNARHPAHFALWGKSVKARTEEVVRKICYHTPRLISSPVCWMGARENLWLLNTQQLLAYPELSRDQRKQPPRKMTLRQRNGRSAAAAKSVESTGPTDTSPSANLATTQVQPQKSKGKQAMRVRGPASAPERMRTRWFRSQRTSRAGVSEDVDAAVSAQQEPVPLREVGPGVLLAEVGAASGNWVDETGVEMGGAGEPEVEVVQDDPSTVAVAPQDEPPTTSTEPEAVPAPTRRSSRQATKRRAMEATMTMASGSGSATPVGFQTRGSSTAVSEASERTVVGKESLGVTSRKRKASQMDMEDAQVMEDKAAKGTAEEEIGRRKKAKRTPGQTTLGMTAAEEQPTTLSTATGKRKAKPRTTTGGRKRRK